MAAFTAYEPHGAGSEFAPKGFSITYGNGYTVNVCFGTVNYADNGETTAEVAVWNDSYGEPFVRVPGFTPIHDQVTGHVTPEELTALLVRVSSATRGEFIEATL